MILLKPRTTHLLALQPNTNTTAAAAAAAAVTAIAAVASAAAVHTIMVSMATEIP